MERTERSAAEAREYNKTILPDHQETFYLAGMNAIAEKFWHLARNAKSDPQQIRVYADMLHDHFEQKIKVEKNSIARRHLDLLEAKSKALKELVEDRTLPVADFMKRVRTVAEIYFPAPNGNHNGHP